MFLNFPVSAWRVGVPVVEKERLKVVNAITEAENSTIAAAI